jgi:hypothetical protein
MTLEEAAAVLRARALTVQVTPDHIVAAAEPREPPAELAKHDVAIVYDFGFAVYRVKDEWAFRIEPPVPTEFFPNLASAIDRAIRYHEEHLAAVREGELATSGDQLAHFYATAPHDGIRGALVDAGWLQAEPDDPVTELGLGYPWGARFLLSHRDRFVQVRLTSEGDAWLLRITCFERGREPGGLFRGRRVLVPADSPPDPEAPLVAYDVALVLHRHLSAVAQDLTWARDRTPTQTDSRDGPVPPTNPSG